MHIDEEAAMECVFLLELGVRNIRLIYGNLLKGFGDFEISATSRQAK